MLQVCCSFAALKIFVSPDTVVFLLQFQSFFFFLMIIYFFLIISENFKLDFNKMPREKA